MSDGNLDILHDGAILRITLNRPDKLNALNRATLVELSDAFHDAALNDDVRVIVLSGAGDKAFAAGADIAELQKLDAMGAREVSDFGQQLMLEMQNMGKPIIAAVNGYALGGGCELALACTLRIASDNAMLGLPEIKLGLMPGYGGSQRLTRLVGAGKALELMLTGDPVDAETAAQLGLVNRVVPQAELAEAVDKLAGKLARNAPLAMAGIIHATHRGADLPLEAGLAIETDRFGLLFGTEDAKEGTSAFLEKRKAEFKGR